MDDKTSYKKHQIYIYSKENVLLKSFSIRSGSNLWVYLRKQNIQIGSACSGIGICGRCDVKIKNEDCKTSPVTVLELKTLKNNLKDDCETRLACMCRVFSDLHISATYW